MTWHPSRATRAPCCIRRTARNRFAGPSTRLSAPIDPASSMRTSRVSGLFAGSLFALVVMASPAAADVLDGVARIAVSVDIEQAVDGVAAEVLERRVVAFVLELAPALTLDAASSDRLRLTVSVRPHSSTALRGFYLPFSSTYAIGSVRLGVERAVQLPGRAAATVPAIVWQRERVVATRWAEGGAAVEAAAVELLEALKAAVGGR